MASELESNVTLCENILQKIQKSDEEREQLTKQLQSKDEEVTKLNEQLKLYEQAGESKCDRGLC
jgi:septal ring factor EnvC (AmiA/AmiB activator)